MPKRSKSDRFGGNVQTIVTKGLQTDESKPVPKKTGDVWCIEI